MRTTKKTKVIGQRKILDLIVKFVSYLLILLPTALGILYVRAFGVSVVYSDAWQVVPLFDKWSAGTLLLSDLFSQSNEHRMPVPKGVELLLATVTKYDNVAEMYLIQACLLVTLIVLFIAFRDSVFSRGAKPAWLLLFVPVSLLVFSFRQYKNMLFGYQINWAFALTFGVLALFLLYISGRSNFKSITFAGALASATIASYSVVQGLLLWPVGLLQLLIGPVEKPAKWVFIFLWSLIGLCEWLVYFVDWVPSNDNSSMFYALWHPAAGAHYFLTLLGSSLFWEQGSAFVGGLLLSCLALASLFLIYRGGWLGDYSFWISLLLYSFLILAVITVGRSELGVEQALARRYTTFSILAVVSIYGMLARMAFDRRSNLSPVLLAALAGGILLSAAISYPNGIKAGIKEKASREEAAYVLSTYESQPDKALKESLHENADSVRARASILQRHGYNVFSEEAQARGFSPPDSKKPGKRRLE